MAHLSFFQLQLASASITKAEVMPLPLFEVPLSKHFYLNRVCKNLCHLFPEVVSYNCFMELERKRPYLLPYSSKLKSNMRGAVMSIPDRLLLRKRSIIETCN